MLVISGAEYASSSFAVLHASLCDALRGSRPKLVAGVLQRDGSWKLGFEDGSVVAPLVPDAITEAGMGIAIANRTSGGCEVGELREDGGPLGGLRVGITFLFGVAFADVFSEVAWVYPIAHVLADRLHRMSGGPSCVRLLSLDRRAQIRGGRHVRLGWCVLLS